jgi:hypothetical protein
VAMLMASANCRQQILIAGKHAPGTGRARTDGRTRRREAPGSLGDMVHLGYCAHADDACGRFDFFSCS